MTCPFDAIEVNPSISHHSWWYFGRLWCYDGYYYVPWWFCGFFYWLEYRSQSARTKYLHWPIPVAFCGSITNRPWYTWKCLKWSGKSFWREWSPALDLPSHRCNHVFPRTWHAPRYNPTVQTSGWSVSSCSIEYDADRTMLLHFGDNVELVR